MNITQIYIIHIKAKNEHNTNIYHNIKAKNEHNTNIYHTYKS